MVAKMRHLANKSLHAKKEKKNQQVNENKRNELKKITNNKQTYVSRKLGKRKGSFFKKRN